MASSPSWLPRLAEALGPTGAVRPLGGGAWRVELAGGRPVLAKVGPGVADEADGLRRLGAVPGGPAVPEVLLVEGDLLVTAWVVQGPRTTAHEERLGRQLAALHGAPVPRWGGRSSTGGGAGAGSRADQAHGSGWGGGSSWIGACRVDPGEVPDGPSFYAGRLLDLAGRCGLAAVVEPVVHRLAELVPFGAPALLHGDLWWGNVLWGVDGRPRLIDPSVHGGHPEEDLAMLALFGTVPLRLLAAYQEVRPLDDGWEERVALWQLYPLLVHTVLFGGGYRGQAEAVTRRYGGRPG